MEQKDNSHKAWAGEKKPSMKRRLEHKDYTVRGIYMVTLAIEGRRSLLGTLQGEPLPHVLLSRLGEAVRDCWQAIQNYYPQVEPMKLCVMPDHIHGILFVHERMERHLGHVIWGFKTGTRKAARNLGLLPTIAAQVAQPTKQEPIQYAALPAQQQLPSRHTASGRAHGTLWEPGYNDRILLRKGQLQRWLEYLDDNPRRLYLKRQHPEYFTQLGTLHVAGVAMTAMGNRFLLERPVKLQVQCSRHLYPHEIEQQKEAFLEAGRQGAVIVSPCISPGEQQIATACMHEGIALIVLLLKGFSPYFKPQPRYLEACSQGRLLMLSPYPFQNERITDMRCRCLHLNELAAAICRQA